ncbi:MAG: hypothetical protein LBQ88_05825 [Treponema sp.]|jgi:hypothetical protein|nr:hypothetical protein [Treponema sp.]
MPVTVSGSIFRELKGITIQLSSTGTEPCSAALLPGILLSTIPAWVETVFLQGRALQDPSLLDDAAVKMPISLFFKGRLPL